jgi:hypothetical protein
MLPRDVPVARRRVRVAIGKGVKGARGAGGTAVKIEGLFGRWKPVTAQGQGAAQPIWRPPLFDVRSEPCCVTLEVEGEAHPAVALELTGQRAALRSRRRVALDDDVHVQLAWLDGATTSLPGVVKSVAPSGADQLVHVEVTGVEGDWRHFLAYLGPTSLAR